MLGIDITRVKVVAVYEGSLIVETQILDNAATHVTNDNGTIEPSLATFQEMKQLELKLTTMLPGSSTLGAVVIDFTVSKF